MDTVEPRLSRSGKIIKPKGKKGKVFLDNVRLTSLILCARLISVEQDVVDVGPNYFKRGRKSQRKSG